MSHRAHSAFSIQPWKSALILLSLACFAKFSLAAATPEWIWHPNNGQPPTNDEFRYFRKTFEVGDKVKDARLTAAADNHFVLFLNGQKVATGDDWQSPERVKVADQLQTGPNALAVASSNDGGPAGFVASLEIEFADGRKQFVVTDASWKTSDQKAANWESRDYVPNNHWTGAKSLGQLGTAPWGNVFALASGSGPTTAKQATPPDSITALPGFEVELVRNAASDEGSWICMTIDDRGRLIVSPQDSKQPLLRLTLDERGQVARTETIDLGVGEAMGLLFAMDSLYANAKGPQGPGVYRLKDSDGDDRLDHVEFLKAMAGGGEHGYHAIRLGPDQKLYVMNGNHTKVPDSISASSPHRNYGEDQLLPRDWDGNGHARGIMAPGGYIVRGDPDGKNWELVLAGFRNAYDFDFNEDGEIFTYDSDMEWD